MKLGKKATILAVTIALMATTAVTAFASSASTTTQEPVLCPNPTCQYVNEDGICEGPRDGSCGMGNGNCGQGLKDGSGAGIGNGRYRRNQSAVCRMDA